MVTSNIGRIFLDAFNEKYKKTYSPKDFFDLELFPLFYNSPKYLLWATNSPFVQMTQGQKVETLSEQDRLLKLKDLHNKLDNNVIDASTAIGFSASETKEFATTSGQMSDIKHEANADDAYLSWIGAGLGIGVSGGLTILVDNTNILLMLYDGWNLYRRYLDNQEMNLPANKLNTWNGQYLNIRLKKDIEPTHLDFQQYGAFTNGKEGITINTVSWTSLFFALSKQYPKACWMTYIYSIGRTNKTIGYIPLYLTEGKRLLTMYEQLFGYQAALDDASKYEQLFGMHILRACELGNIGLRAMEPDMLTVYYKGKKDFIFTAKTQEKELEQIILYRTFKTWLLTMITKNKEEMLNATARMADILYTYRQNDKALSTNRKNKIVELLEASRKTKFFDALSELLSGLEKDDIPFIKEYRDWIHELQSDEFQYAQALLNFDYKYAEYKN